MTSPQSPPSPRPPRPDLLRAGKGRLSFFERLSLRVLRASLEPGLCNRFLQWCQRNVGQAWIHAATRNLLHVRGWERLPDLSSPESILIVANHRSFFDLYVITAELVRRGLKKRIVFPVRSQFFYDSPFGLVVNFWMSFLAMYPPLFRDRKKAALNLHSLEELGFLLHRGDVFVGIHPEGTRKRDDDPYSFLPAQPGVGRIIYQSRVQVVPVFIHGLGNNILQQIRQNFSRKGTPIHVVFGEPLDLSELLDQKASPRLYRQISERCMEAIGTLGQEEKQWREASSAEPSTAPAANKRAAE